VLFRANLHYSVFCNVRDGKRLATAQGKESLKKIFFSISLSTEKNEV